MGKNNFEKQVQEKMAELNIQPSEKAWAGIESRIGKKSSRRKMLWFLLPGLFLLAGGAYLFLIGGKGNDQKISQLPKQNTETIIQKKAIDQRSSDDSIIATIPAELSESKQVSTRSTYKSAESIYHSLDTLRKNKKTNQMFLIGNEKMNSSAESQVLLVKSQDSATEINASAGQKEVSKIALVSNPDSIAESLAVLAQQKEDSSSGNKVFITESLTSNQETASEKKKEIVIKENGSLYKIHKKWKIGMTFSTAKAYIGDGIHLGSNQDKSFISFDPGFNYNSPASRPGISLGQASIGPASSPKNSIGFKAGIILKKEISAKTSFVTGLGYTYYTNTILIGNQSPEGNYSSVGMLSPYRNNFHFVDLPLSAQFHLNKKHKIPLDLSLGITLSQLISSDAVQYKQEFYEVDNSLFTKTQFGFNAGFSTTFFRNLSVGPFYHYGVNSLAKEGIYGKKHLNFLGIKADFIFQKNK